MTRRHSTAPRVATDPEAFAGASMLDLRASHEPRRSVGRIEVVAEIVMAVVIALLAVTGRFRAAGRGVKGLLGTRS
jgi:hypothetical protein